MSTIPAFRKLRAYSFDPLLSLRMDTVAINNLTYKIDWEKLGPGPSGEYLEVIDYDPSVGKYYTPVNLDDPNVLAQDGLDPSESNPQFHQQMVYVVAMTTITNFEKALGRKVLWASRHLKGRDYVKGRYYEEFVPQLRLYPHALRDANAYYSPLKKAVLFGYFSSAPPDETLLMPDSLVFTCLSHDIIAHEVTHAILDGMHNYYNEATNPDVLAFHEAFADIVALFQHFTFPEVLKHQISKTRGDLTSQNLLGELAQQFGTAIGGYGSLRDAIGQYDSAGKWQPKVPEADDYRQVMEPHERGSILVAAVFEAFLAIYKVRISDLLRIASGGSGILALGELHPDLVNRLATEASKAASHVLSMCIRALDYCPPVDITFGEYLRAIITADIDLVRDDQFSYRLAFIDAFRRRGIYPTGIKTLSVESLQLKVWNIGEDKDSTHPVLADVDEDTRQLFSDINDFLRGYADKIKYTKDRKKIYDLTREYIRGAPAEGSEGLHMRMNIVFADSPNFSPITGLVFDTLATNLGIATSHDHSKPSFEIQNMRLVNRVGPDGTQINQVIFSIVQRCGVVMENGKFDHHFVPGRDPLPATNGNGVTQAFEFRGGCTLIFDLNTSKLKYIISKPLLDMQSIGILQIDQARVKRQFEYLYGKDGTEQNEYALYFGENTHNLSEPFCFLHQH